MLQILGLSAEEEDLYEWLLEHPALALRTFERLVIDKPWANQAPALLSRLTGLGMVVRLPGRPVRYQAVAPGDIPDALLLAGERQLARARLCRERLAAAFHRSRQWPDQPDLFEIVHGKSAIIERITEVLRSARREVRMCNAPPYLGRPPVTAPVEPKPLRQGIRYRVLYDRTELAAPGRLTDLGNGLAMGEQARVTDVPMKLVLSDHPLALFLPEPGNAEIAVVAHDSALVEALSAFFELVWDRAIPLQVRNGRMQLAEASNLPSELDSKLLPLLAAGLTDAAIAAHLGCNERTVRRHLRDMLHRLGAADRFQAGYQAIQRGWLTTDQLPV